MGRGEGPDAGVLKGGVAMGGGGEWASERGRRGVGGASIPHVLFILLCRRLKGMLGGGLSAGAA